MQGGRPVAVRLGINPITWSNDDVPSLGGDTPLETCLRETRAAGFSGTELGGKFPRKTKALRALLGAHDLSLVSGWFDGRILERDVDAEFAAIASHLELLRDLGCEVVVYADTSRGRQSGIFEPASRRPRLGSWEWEGYGRKVSELASRMAEFGVRMAFHHHMGTIIETDHEVDLLMRHSTDKVGLLLDTGHCLYSGGDPHALREKHQARITHVHCKDVRPEILERAVREDMSFMEAVMAGIFTVPGDGSIDYARLLRPLREAGYDGWLVVEAEQDPAVANPMTYAAMGHRNLRAFAEEAGFIVSDRRA
jgi:inosose dehydratase